MKRPRNLLLALLALSAGLVAVAPAPAQSESQAEVNAALRADTRVHSSLMTVGIAAVIAEFCPTIDAREFRARADALALYNYARSLGFTHRQLRTFIRDPDERARMEREIRAWFAARGLQQGGPAEGFCALGHSEIASGAPSARYLRAR